MQRQQLASFDDLDYGDQIVYVGPDDHPAPYAAPLDRDQPYTFEHVSFGDTLVCETKYGSRKYLARSHPANNPEYWRRADGEEVSQ